MDFDELFRLSDAGLKGALHVRPTSHFDHVALVSGATRPSSPLVFEYSAGQSPRDLISTEYPGVHIVSQKAIDVFHLHKFKGWDVFPVTIFGKGRNQLDGYHGFVVKGKCGPINRTLSKVVSVSSSRSSRSFEAWQGLFFDLRSWDGSDIFMPQGTLFKLVTEPVKNALAEAKVSNIMFQKLSDIAMLKI